MSERSLTKFRDLIMMTEKDRNDGVDRKENLTKLRKQQILDAARDVFSRKGYDKATTAEIAQVAGVAEGTIYNYFLNKRALLISLISSYIGNEPVLNLSEHMSKSSAPPLSSLIKERLGIGFEDVDLQLLLLGEIQRDPELAEQYVAEVLQPGLKLTREYLKSGIKEGVFRSLDTDVAVRVLVGMMLGLIVLYKVEGEKGFLRGIPYQELATEMAELFLEGIKRK